MGWAPARRKFFGLHTASKRRIALRALRLLAQLCEIEWRRQSGMAGESLRLRQQQIRPLLDKLGKGLSVHRAKVSEGAATAKLHGHDPHAWLKHMMGRRPISP